MATGMSGTHGHTRTETNWLAIGGLASGIIGLIFLAILFGPIAILLGALALRQAGKGGNGMAKAAIVLGIVDTVIGVVLMLTRGFGLFIGG
ncbi:DUF4190 domain-containing protein [Streptomyces sp. NPDC088745]|uniref:DUF4190 domain-containing protein n=1 Tax=Streptomyces sp. NPDC088745 TaxID=3365884 RepID=UPI003818087E